MQLFATQAEIAGILQDLSSDYPQLAPIKDIFVENVTFNSNITFKKKLKLGQVEISVEPEAKEGDIILDLANVKIAGIGILALVRKKAGEMIIEAIKEYFPYATAIKNNEGNIQIHIPGANVVTLGVAFDRLILNMIITG